MSKATKLQRLPQWIFQGFHANFLDLSGCEKVREITQEIFHEALSLRGIELPPNIEVIHYGAFSVCGSLRGADMRRCARLRCIKDYSFADTRIEELYIGPKLEVIEPMAFHGSLSIRKIFIHKDNHNFKVVNNTLLSAENKTSVLYARTFHPRVLRVPAGVRRIGAYTYQRVESWFVDLGEEVEEIGEGAFSRSRIREIRVPDSVFVVGPSAFSHCEELKTAEFGRGVTQIPAFCFAGCARLENVILRAVIIKVCARAFSECPAIENCVAQKRSIPVLAESDLPFKALTSGARANVSEIEPRMPTTKRIREMILEEERNATASNDDERGRHKSFPKNRKQDNQEAMSEDERTTNDFSILRDYLKNINRTLPRIIDGSY